MIMKAVDPQGPSDEDYAVADQFVRRIGEVLETAFHAAAKIEDPEQRHLLIGNAFMTALSNTEGRRRFLSFEDRSLRP